MCPSEATQFTGLVKYSHHHHLIISSNDNVVPWHELVVPWYDIVVTWHVIVFPWHVKQQNSAILICIRETNLFPTISVYKAH
jgi:hypothetical protein